MSYTEISSDEPLTGTILSLADNGSIQVIEIDKRPLQNLVDASSSSVKTIQPKFESYLASRSGKNTVVTSGLVTTSQPASMYISNAALPGQRFSLARSVSQGQGQTPARQTIPVCLGGQPKDLPMIFLPPSSGSVQGQGQGQPTTFRFISSVNTVHSTTAGAISPRYKMRPPTTTTVVMSSLSPVTGKAPPMSSGMMTLIPKSGTTPTMSSSEMCKMMENRGKVLTLPLLGGNVATTMARPVTSPLNVPRNFHVPQQQQQPPPRNPRGRGGVPGILSRSKSRKRTPQMMTPLAADSLSPALPTSVFGSSVIHVGMQPALAPASAMMLASSSSNRSTHNVVFLSSSMSATTPILTASSLGAGGGGGQNVIHLATIAMPGGNTRLRVSSPQSSGLNSPAPQFFLSGAPVAAGAAPLTQLLSAPGILAPRGGMLRTPTTTLRMLRNQSSPMNASPPFVVRNVTTPLHPNVATVISPQIRHDKPAVSPILSSVRVDAGNVDSPRMDPGKVCAGDVDALDGGKVEIICRWDEMEGCPRKRRKLMNDEVYSISIPNGNKIVGKWKNSDVKFAHFSSFKPTETSVSMGDGAEETDVVMASGDKSYTSNISVERSDKKVQVEKVVITEKATTSPYLYCSNCRILSINAEPVCPTCNTPKLSVIQSADNNPQKQAQTTTNLSHDQGNGSTTGTMTPLPATQQALSVNTTSAGQTRAVRPVQRIVMMQMSGSSKQIPISKRPLVGQRPEFSPLRIRAPFRLQTGSPLMVAAGARALVPRLVRKKVLPPSKQQEPDVVFLSSDDEDHSESGSKSSKTVAETRQSDVMPSPSRLEMIPTVVEGEGTGEQPCSDETQAMDTAESGAAAAAASDVVPIDKHLFTIKIRMVRFGKLQCSSVKESSFYMDRISIVFPTDETIGTSAFFIPVEDIRTALVHFGPCGAVVFLHTTASLAAKVQKVFCKMSMAIQDPQFFNPDHPDEANRLIIIVPDKNQIVADEYASSMLKKMHDNCPEGKRFNLQFINGDAASQLLKSRMSSTAAAAPAAMTPASTVIFITNNGQIIQRHIMLNDFAAQAAAMARPTEGDEEEEVADRSRSPSPPHPMFNGPILKLFTYPPPPATGGITVTNEDFFCLRSGEFLNDVIIDFYLKYLLREVLSEEDRGRTHVFSSFFYRRLTQKQAREQNTGSNMTLQQIRHSRVKTWTRHVDLFKKDFIVVPINESAHWYLAIVCFPGLCKPTSLNAPNTLTPDNAEKKDAFGNEENGVKPENEDDEKKSTTAIKQPCILIFDSLALTSRYGVVRTLREYLQTEWDAKKKATEGEREFNKDSMQGACPRCPRQTNFSDCGVYVLQYVESFFKDPIPNYSLPISSTVNWFSEEVIDAKRQALRQLVLQLQRGLNPELNFDPSLQNSNESVVPTASGSGLQQKNSTSVETRDVEQEKEAVEENRGNDSTASVEMMSVDEFGIDDVAAAAAAAARVDVSASLEDKPSEETEAKTAKDDDDDAGKTAASESVSDAAAAPEPEEIPAVCSDDLNVGLNENICVTQSAVVVSTDDLQNTDTAVAEISDLAFDVSRVDLASSSSSACDVVDKVVVATSRVSLAPNLSPATSSHQSEYSRWLAAQQSKEKEKPCWEKERSSSVRGQSSSPRSSRGRRPAKRQRNDRGADDVLDVNGHSESSVVVVRSTSQCLSDGSSFHATENSLSSSTSLDLCRPPLNPAQIAAATDDLEKDFDEDVEENWP